jgi:hypothetical protein
MVWCCSFIDSDSKYVCMVLLSKQQTVHFDESLFLNGEFFKRFRLFCWRAYEKETDVKSRRGGRGKRRERDDNVVVKFMDTSFTIDHDSGSNQMFWRVGGASADARNFLG